MLIQRDLFIGFANRNKETFLFNVTTNEKKIIIHNGKWADSTFFH